MTSYIDIELGGKKRRVYFDIWTIGELLELLETDVVTLIKNASRNPFKYMPLILYYGLKSDYDHQGKKHDFTLLDVGNWISELEGSLDNPEIVRAFGHFIATTTKNVAKPEDNEPEENGEADGDGGK